MGPVARWMGPELSGAIGGGERAIRSYRRAQRGGTRIARIDTNFGHCGQTKDDAEKELCGQMRFFAVFCGSQHRSRTMKKFSTKWETRFSEGGGPGGISAVLSSYGL